MLRAAQRAGVDDTAATDNFVAMAVGVAVEDIVVALVDEGCDFAGYMAVGDSDPDAGEQLAAEMVSGDAAGIEVEQGLANG